MAFLCKFSSKHLKTLCISRLTLQKRSLKVFSPTHFNTIFNENLSKEFEQNELQKTINYVKDTIGKLGNKDELFAYYGWKLDYSFVYNLILLGKDINLDQIYPIIQSNNIKLPQIPNANHKRNFHKEWCDCTTENTKVVENNDKGYLEYLMAICSIADCAVNDSTMLFDQNITKHEYFNYTLYSYVFTRILGQYLHNHKNESKEKEIVKNDLILVDYIRQCTPNAVIYAWQPKEHL